MRLSIYGSRRRAPPQPIPTRWVRHLQADGEEDDTLLFSPTRGRIIQNIYPGIRPAKEGNKENDRYGNLQRFKIRVRGGGRSHVAVVHKYVVLHQSQWLRDEVARLDDPEAPVSIPSHIKWWQVAWALEYMYEGRVPGFQVLASERMPVRYPTVGPRSIAWGLLELWEVADFFGLNGLKERAEGAFMEYFAQGIRHCILTRRGACARELVGGAPRHAPLAWRGPRVAYEFNYAAWRIFGESDEIQGYDFMSSYYGWRLDRKEAAVLTWESDMFDKAGASDDEDAALEDTASNDPTPQYHNTFKSKLTELCMAAAPAGLFELEWFQEIVLEGEGCPHGLMGALAQRMREPNANWPRDEYPRAPFSFERVDPWRLIGSNARPVPVPPTLGNVRQGGPNAQQ